MLKPRYGLAVVLAAVITGGLLFTMQALIASGKSALTDDREFKFLDFVRAQRQEMIERKQQKPEKPPPPKEPPPDMPQPQQDAVDPNVQTIGVAPVLVSADMSIGGFGLAISDGDYLPIVKVAPVYPRRALSRGLEGYVIVEFTVTKTGSVRDPFIVESTSSLFENAALKAVLRFKYKPRIVDGEPIEVAGVQNKITFILEDS
ncbi:MAG: energy transducer TonB [Proteobacteria bacterium]|nr:energy transducer TonB [Pseudomonadota bacterium]